MDVGTGSVIGDGLMNIIFAAAIVIVGRIAVKWIVKLIRKLMVRADLDPIIINFAGSIANAALLLFVFIAALDQLGVDTTSLIVLLGGAGLAIGLALQGSLQNFAAGVMMIVFRPFRLGDFIEAGGVTGVVEHIAIFSSTLKTGDNREIIIPNGQIYSGAITNYSAKDTRRIDLVFGIGYDDDMLTAKQIMEDILQTHDLVLADPASAVAVAELADSSVNFNVRPWVKSEDYWAVRSDLIEKIKLAFDKNGISIPYPQMDVHTDK
ncbi:mechanosensitive ion channel protein MscS [Methylophaga sp. 42_25_T18]|nr:mechanosensitive ion channel protein MscS [Methylophaga sp. 42_25_T18]OUR85884.1 mechanosensitive ion channel protein MscS [Methylophaga sp. 42_8_T64]